MLSERGFSFATVQYIEMQSHVVANITEPERKLEDLERRLKYKLERAREITSTSSLEEPLDKTQEELMN